MLFILTSDFTFYLYKHSAKEGLTLINSHSLKDPIAQRRDPPYSVVLGAKSKFLALNLYENMVKVIPIEKSGGVVQATSTFNLRIRHPEAISFIPLHQDELVHDGPLMVFYKQ